MKALYDLRAMLEDELQAYGAKGDLSAGALDIVDKLTHTIKNLDKIIDCDEGYSEGMGYSRRRNVRRDSMGRYASDGGYSRHGDLVEELHHLMADAPNDQIRHDLKRLADKLEQM